MTLLQYNSFHSFLEKGCGKAKVANISDGDRFQKTCKVGDSADYTFVGKVIVGPYIAALLLQRFLICFIILTNKLGYMKDSEVTM